MKISILDQTTNCIIVSCLTSDVTYQFSRNILDLHISIYEYFSLNSRLFLSDHQKKVFRPTVFVFSINARTSNLTRQICLRRRHWLPRTRRSVTSASSSFSFVFNCTRTPSRIAIYLTFRVGERPLINRLRCQRFRPLRSTINVGVLL
jgi:hypothetical protein